MALTRNDFICGGVDEYRLNINKNYEVVRGTAYILTPKADSSIRCITIPLFLYYEAIQYFEALYEPDPNEACFTLPKAICSMRSKGSLRPLASLPSGSMTSVIPTPPF